MYVCGPGVQIPRRPEEETNSPGTGVIVTMQTLGTECRAFGRAASNLNHWAIPQFCSNSLTRIKWPKSKDNLLLQKQQKLHLGPLILDNYPNSNNPEENFLRHLNKSREKQGPSQAQQHKLFNCRTWEPEVGGFELSQPDLHSKFHDSPGYRERPCLKQPLPSKDKKKRPKREVP